MKINWPIIGMGVVTLCIGYSIFTNGFFVTLISTIIFAAIIMLYLRLTGRM